MSGGGYAVLAGLRVLDLGIITAGASTSAMLADLGAEVIKIEGPTYVDPFRNWFGEANTPNWWNESPQFIATNRNKRGICLDLKSARGRELFLALVADSDIIVENFRAGVLARLDIAYDAMAAVNKRIIVASISSQGANGPGAHNVSFGSTLEASSGMSWLTRYTGGRPHISGRALNYPDQVVSLFAAGAILAAVIHRNRTGEGAHLDLSQRELTSFLVGEAILGYDASASATAPSNPVESGIDYQGIFTAADDSHVAVTIPAHAAQRVSALLDNAPEKPALDEWIRARPVSQIVAELRALGVAAEAIVSGKDRGESALPTRNAFAFDLNGISVKGLPIRMGNDDVGRLSPAPALGQHNREIALERLGLSPDEYAALVEAGIFASRPAKVAA
jgi:crotonobetainyl-CoA:carnitine CoA-transferase CaiB-like acyl-CoA transferase